MTVGTDYRASLPTMGTPQANLTLRLDPDSPATQPRSFRRHKVLPHPRGDDAHRSSLLRYSLGNEAASLQNGGAPGSGPSSRQRGSRVGRGPEPPPTPPAHSRTSSASHPADPSTPKVTSTPPDSADNVESRPPATPPHQQTPPTPNLTPDQTPPGPATSHAQRRPPISQRNSSKVTTGSRAESFQTARENLDSSDDDDDGRSTVRPELPSARTSQSTVRQISREKRSASQPVGLGLALESSSTKRATPRTPQEFPKFDGEWASAKAGTNHAEQEWNPKLMKNVTIRKRRPTRPKEDRNQEITDDRAVTPTNATRALRSMSFDESPIVYPSRRAVSDRFPTRAAPAESTSSVDVKRSSIVSTKSNASTVVEAVLLETAPQRRQTLRHIRKQTALRDSGSEISPANSAPGSVSPAIDGRRQRPEPSVHNAGEGVRESYASTATNNSISSRKARRSVWKNGGVPVVVIPARKSSVKSNSKSPSLRSTSSRRSQSLSSVPTSQPSRSREHVPHSDRPTRRNRALSESDGSRAGDERTMDFPPVIPTRSSSLSAPTSRNASRTGSLTAESLKAHNVFQAQQAHRALLKASRELDKLNKPPQHTGDDRRRNRRAAERPQTDGESAPRQSIMSKERSPRDRQSELSGSPSQTNRDSHNTHRGSDSLGVDRDGDPFFGKRLSVQNTPFSVVSVETTATSQAEVSEAMAVNIYPHQSKSVVLVNHSAKPSDSSSLEQYKTSAPTIPVIKTTDANGGVPVTPPQQFPGDDVDSPLRNPRAPPKPPAINFIPATPSGMTPTTEKQRQLGNYYEMTAEKPKRSRSLLKQALTRRTTEYGPAPSRPVGFLARTLSLSRDVKGRSDNWAERPRLKRRSTAGSVPADESRLHPHWRPSYYDDDRCSCCSCCDDEYDEDDHRDHRRGHDGDRTYRYPPIDNRPAPPRRRLSDRIKRTFAILPARDDRPDYDDYPATANDAPDRRTIRRTPSGNLRVMKFRGSMESLTRPARASESSRYPPITTRQRPGSGATRPVTRLWRSLSWKARQSLRRASSLSSRTTTASGDAAAVASNVSDGNTTGNGNANISGATTAGFPPPRSDRPNLPRRLSDRINLPRRLSERRREKRTQELRGKISGPREVRDGVGDVIRRNSWRGGGVFQLQGQLQGQDYQAQQRMQQRLDADADALYVREQQRERMRQREERREREWGEGLGQGRI